MIAHLDPRAAPPAADPAGRGRRRHRRRGRAPRLLGAFLAHSKATMTDRAVRSVGVDWQVQVQPRRRPGRRRRRRRRHAPASHASAAVGFGQSSGLSATTGGTTQTTGPAVVLGVPDTYRRTFPGQLRTLAGADTGVLLAQQTAANLHAAPGDTVIDRPRRAAAGHGDRRRGRRPAAGRLAVPERRRARRGSQPTAPPDNVAAAAADHVAHGLRPAGRALGPTCCPPRSTSRAPIALPADPAAAYTAVTAAAHNLEAVTAGGAVVGDNLGAALGAARGDAAYAQVLFLFLGLPGAILAGLLTATIASAGAARRRGEQALLRARGATAAQLIRLAAVEAPLTGVAGCRARAGRRRHRRPDRLRHRQLRHHHRPRARLGGRRGRRRPAIAAAHHPGARPPGPAERRPSPPAGRPSRGAALPVRGRVTAWTLSC